MYHIEFLPLEETFEFLLARTYDRAISSVLLYQLMYHTLFALPALHYKQVFRFRFHQDLFARA
jgi:hypothetical protein